MFKNVASQKLIVFAFDATTNTPKTGDAANITAYVSKDYGAATVLGDTSATELDSTNSKGYYLFDLTQAETNADCLNFTAKSSTANIVVIGVPAVVFTVPANFTAASIDSSGRVDVAKIAGTSQTARDIGASVLLSAGTGTGQLDFTSGVVKANATQIAGSAVSTSIAQIGVNVVNAAGTAWASGAITSSVLATDCITSTQISTTAAQEIRNSITGGAYPLDTDANGRIRIVDGTGTGELDTSSGRVFLANGTHGGPAAVLQLERFIAVSLTTDEPAMKLVGNGFASGIDSSGCHGAFWHALIDDGHGSWWRGKRNGSGRYSLGGSNGDGEANQGNKGGAGTSNHGGADGGDGAGDGPGGYWAAGYSGPGGQFDNLIGGKGLVITGTNAGALELLGLGSSAPAPSVVMTPGSLNSATILVNDGSSGYPAVYMGGKIYLAEGIELTKTSGSPFYAHSPDSSPIYLEGVGSAIYAYASGISVSDPYTGVIVLNGDGSAAAGGSIINTIAESGTGIKAFNGKFAAGFFEVPSDILYAGADSDSVGAQIVNNVSGGGGGGSPTTGQIVTAIMTELLSSSNFNTSGSFGKLIKDNLNATISSRSSHTAADIWAVGTRTLTALGFTFGSGDFGTDWLTSTGLAISAVQEIRNAITGGAYPLDTDANGRVRLVDGTAAGEIDLSAGLVTLASSQNFSTSGAVGSVTGNVGGNLVGSVGSLATQAKVDVNAEIVDCLNVDTYSMPGASTPPTTPTIAQAIMQAFKIDTNPGDQDANFRRLYNRAGNTVEQKRSVSDNTVTATLGALVAA